MDERPNEDRRAYFRIRYPRVERPTIRIGQRDFAVSELSEGGARIVGVNLTQGDQKFPAEICFPDGDTVSIEGVVLRHTGSETAVEFSKRIAAQRMFAEQMRLCRKYPMLFSQDNRD